MNYLGIGVGAGLVSALLIAVVAKATPLALVLFLLAPLPVLIAALGWNHRAGLVAALVGGVAISLFDDLLGGVAFAVGTALPAWWLAYLALLGRPMPDGAVEWYPTGRLLGWIAGTAALTVLASALISAGDYETFRRTSREIAEAFFRIEPGRSPVPPGTDLSGLADRLAAAAPFLAAQGFTLILTFYIYAAGRIVRASGRLPRPWPDLARTAMPRAALLALAGGAALATVGGFPGVFGLGLAGALSMGFGLQGLAFIHDVTRGRPLRFAILAGLYGLVFLSQGLVLGFTLLLGLADTAFALRRPRPDGAVVPPPSQP